MRGFARLIVVFTVAGTLPATVLVAGQAQQKADAPKITTTTTTEKVEAKDAVKLVEKVEGKATTETTVEVKANDPKIEVGAEKAAAKDEVKKSIRKPVAQAKAADKAAVAVAPVVMANGVNLDPWIQRFVQQLRPMVRSEIHMIVTSCAPTKEQKKAIGAESERILKDVSKTCAEAQMGVGRRTVDFVYPDARKLIAEAMAVVVKEKMSAEQMTLYQKESDAKAVAFKKTAVDNLVANLDEELILSAEQRVKLVESLQTNWKEGWCNSLQVLMYGNQFFPKIPDEFIVPILNPTQKKVWEKKPKNNNVFWGNFGVAGNNIMIDDEIEFVEPPPPAGAAAVGGFKAVEKVEKKVDAATKKQ